MAIRIKEQARLAAAQGYRAANDPYSRQHKRTLQSINNPPRKVPHG